MYWHKYYRLVARHIVGSILLGLFLLGGNTPLSFATEMASRAPFPVVLMYHDIKPVPVNDFDVTVEDFQKQLAWLQQKGYTTLSAEEFGEKIKTRQAFPEKSVLITFDDGYQGIYTYAAPELRKRNMQAVFFLIPTDFDQALPQYPYVTTEQVLSLAAEPNFAIGSHTMTHPDLGHSSAVVIQEELTRSKETLTRLTGKPCNLFAYPCGIYNQAVINAVKAAGYTAAFAVSDKGLQGEAARFSIPRIYMGTIMGKNNLQFFKYSVEHYKEMPQTIFAERYHWRKETKL
jgi:peptidoglycan/xylan/chitin deacetylase (PgdA/CDA1 family)